MDDFDVFSSQPPATSGNDLFDTENTNTTTEIQKEDSSWIIENNPDTTSSIQPDIFGENNVTSTDIFQSNDTMNTTTSFSSPSTELNDNMFDIQETQKETPSMMENTLSNTSTSQRTEDQSSMNMFVTETVSPLQAITKKREEEIAAKDVEERRKIDELRQQAKSDLERWYKDRQQQMEQHRQTMKSDEDDLRTKALEKSTKDSCDWTKVMRLLELNDGTQLSKSKRDLTRMKSCMLTARRAAENKKLANGV
ncbi:hypothetical protein I4U23_002040 [Adineta vaga]|nr:hypothetical protein I4U23_002040 [Adineta vaga]